MNIKIINNIAIINSETPVINDAQSALDLITSVYYETNTNKIAVNKAAICEDFFRLSTGLAGEIVQKFVNYNFQVAIYGDFSCYTSKPLLDYMYECNKGKHLYFVKDEDEAVTKLESNRDTK